MVWQWKITQAECAGCGICADVCPESAIRMTRDMAYPEPVPAKCVGCMVCPPQCPLDAIVVSELAVAGR